MLPNSELQPILTFLRQAPRLLFLTEDLQSILICKKENQHMIRNIVRIITILCALGVFSGITFAQAGGTDPSTSSSSKKAKTSKKSSSKKVDVNSATKEDLVATGIDEDAAQKIIDGRPYKTKRDLVTKNILTQDQYDKVKDNIIAHGGKTKKSAKKDTDTTK
jgi:DNA uptake protein ComE-like DNA-binding protein